VTEPFGGGVQMPYGTGRRMMLRAERVGEGQFLVTLAHAPLAVIVFTTARDDDGAAPPHEIADRLEIEYGVPVYSAIERFVLADFARGVHALLEKAERDCAAAPPEPDPEMAPIRVWSDLVTAIQTIGHLEAASAALRAPDMGIDVTDLVTGIDRRIAALIGAIGGFVHTHRQETLADGFPTVEFPLAVPGED
jgi:hypothetical protein